MADEKNLNIDSSEEKKSADKSPKKIENKPSLGKKIKNFLREYKSEIKKIVWPTREQVIKNTGIVITVFIIVAVFVGLLDIGFVTGINLLGDVVRSQ